MSFFNRSSIAIPMAIFAMLTIIVLVASSIYQGSLQRAMQATIDRLAEESHIRTSARLEAYSLFTRSSMGFLKSSEEATNDRWNTHLEAMRINSDYPSVAAIGYGDVGGIADLESGALDVKYIYPQGDAVANNSASKLGVPSDSIRHTMIEAARTGQVQMAEAYLWRDGADAQSEYLLYLFMPIYTDSEVPDLEADRLGSLEGVVFIATRVDVLFNAVYQDHNPAIMWLAVSQSVDGRPVELFSRGTQESPSSAIKERRTLNIMGQQLTYDYSFSRANLVSIPQRYMSIAIPFVGLVLSLLLAMVISFTLRARNQRMHIAREREVQDAKDELLSLASHQLRTPATGVKQYLGMVIQGFAGSISDTQRDFLERAYASNERQLHIINDILYLAKLDAGRIVLTKTKFDLAELVRSTTEELQESARQAELSMTVSTPKKASALADEHMLRMVIENLITNAVKYTPPGGEIAVRLIRAGDSYEIAVTDTGVGVEPEDIPKLFRQFTRIPNERSSQVSGTGVGLYLARSLARMHDGDIRVKSKLGKGTTFTIVVPRGL